MNCSFGQKGSRKSFLAKILSVLVLSATSLQMTFAAPALLSNGYMSVQVTRKEIVNAEAEIGLYSSLRDELVKSLNIIDVDGHNHSLQSKEVRDGKVQVAKIELKKNSFLGKVMNAVNAGTSLTEKIKRTIKHSILNSNDTQKEITDKKQYEENLKFLDEKIGKPDDWGERIAAPIFLLGGVAIVVILVAVIGVPAAGVPVGVLATIISTGFATGLISSGLTLGIKRGTGDLLFLVPGYKATKFVLQAEAFKKIVMKDARESVLRNKYNFMNQICRDDLAHLKNKLMSANGSAVNYEPGNIALSLIKWEDLNNKIESFAAGKNLNFTMNLNENFLQKEKAHLVVISKSASNDFNEVVRDETMMVGSKSCEQDAYMKISGKDLVDHSIMSKYKYEVENYCNAKKLYLNCRDELKSKLHSL